VSHPWLDGRLSKVESLSDTVRMWTFLAGNTAKGDLQAVGHDWRCLAQDDHLGGIEAILQTHLFAGYPRTINALATVRGLGVSPGVRVGEVDSSMWTELGEGNCRTIYGSAYDRLRDRIAGLHPDIDRWMVEIGYGRILSRPGLTLRERELCVIAVLAGQNVAPQLSSHLRGAMRAGATPVECTAILEQTDLVWGPEARRQVDIVWGELR